MNDVAVSVTGLRKRYGRQDVLRDIDLDVRRGETYALLGPNGAGKTTTIEIMEGHGRHDGGHVRVLGMDPQKSGRALRSRVGILLQGSGVEDELRVDEIVGHTAALYPHPLDPATVIERLGLAPRSRAQVGTLSGGERRRLDVALALVGDPELLFLDEPTSNLDPAGRRLVWQLIDEVRARGGTVVVTTHAIDEAERTADRIGVIVGGRVVASGSLAELVGTEASEISCVLEAPIEPDVVGRVLQVEEIRVEGPTLTMASTKPVEVVRRLTAWAHEHEIRLTDLRVQRPRLEDVYLDLVQTAEVG